VRLTIAIFFPLLASTAAWSPETAGIPPNEVIRGGVIDQRGIFLITWGDKIRLWNVETLQSNVLTSQGTFGEGGCITADRKLIQVRGRGPGDLLPIDLATRDEERIDTAVEMHDCLETTLFGRRGVLLIHRGMQLRLYSRTAGAWTSRDLYSIYTPSYQTGLKLRDVDRDGRTDILLGNYWLRQPAASNLHWRLFAIHKWFENAESASVRIALLPGGRIAVAQAHESPSRFSRFDPPPDPTLLWRETKLAPKYTLTKIHALTVDPRTGKLLAGELNGPGSRILAVEPETGNAQVVATNNGTITLLPAANNVFAVTPNGLIRYSAN
jgi:hypothetical protein